VEPCRRQALLLPDGRRMSYQEFGAVDGRPVFYCHGFPASRLEARLVAAVAEKCGLRMIAADRPGYGYSDPAPRHSLKQWTDDLALLADHLSCDRFRVLGVSGGGPYALATARFLPERIEKVTLVCPLGPLERCDALRKFAPTGQLFFGLARRHRVLLKLLVGSVALPVRMGWPGLVLRLLAGDPPPADRRILEDSQIRQELKFIIAEAFRQGSAAACDELIRYVSPWGFELSQLSGPVTLWHGEEDRTVPVEAGRRLAAALPGCRALFLPGEGHYSLPLGQTDPILKDLAAD